MRGLLQNVLDTYSIHNITHEEHQLHCPHIMLLQEQQQSNTYAHTGINRKDIHGNGT